MKPSIPVIVLLAGFATAASGGSPSDWLPLSVGSVKTYAGRWDRIYEPSNGPRERIFGEVRIEERVTAKEPRSDRSGDIFRVFEQILQRNLDGTAEDRRRRESYFSLGADGAFVRFGETGSPIRILSAAPGQGARWSAGRLRVDEVETELSGEVLGFESVDLSGTVLPRCLHVRLSGTPGGRAESPGGRARLTGGRLEMDFWFAEGVGIVKAETRSDFELEEGKGEAMARTRLSTVITRRLDRSSLAP